MSEEYSVEIVNPEKSFLSKDDVTEVVVPRFTGVVRMVSPKDSGGAAPAPSSQGSNDFDNQF